MAGRPTVSDPKQPLTGRVRGITRKKFLVVADRERRKPSDLVSIVLEDFVAAYEKEHGEITLPASPAPTAASRDGE